MSSLTERWRLFSETVAKCSRRPGEKNIHDMRVAARRFVAVVDMFYAIIPDLPAVELRRSLRRHIRDFGPLRDTQVHLVRVRALARKFPAFEIGATVLKVREGALIKEARKALRTLDMRRLEMMSASLGARAAEHFAGQPDRSLEHDIIAGELAKAFVRVIRRRGPALMGNARSVHECRIAFKKFRYLVEILQPVLPALDGRLLHSMKRFQTCVGKLHDHDLLMSGVSPIIRRYQSKNSDQYACLSELLRSEREVLMTKFVTCAGKLERLKLRIHQSV
jgi:CHAD domain-containing protein